MHDCLDAGVAGSTKLMATTNQNSPLTSYEIQCIDSYVAASSYT